MVSLGTERALEHLKQITRSEVIYTRVAETVQDELFADDCPYKK